MKSCIRLSFQLMCTQIVVCRSILRDDLGVEVEGIEKAVHIHHDAADYQRIQPRGAAYDNKQAEHGDERESPLHIALIHLARAGDAGKQQGQDSVFLHSRFPHFFWLETAASGSAADSFLPNSRLSSVPVSFWDRVGFGSRS